MTYESLEGKFAVVTGASRGIGASVALELASRGANVLVHYSASESKAQDVASKIRAMGRKAELVKSDLASKECGKEIMEAAAKFSCGKIGIVVLCAGVSWVNYIRDIDATNIDHDFSEQMDINVRSVVLCVNAALPYLEKPSRIVLFSSTSARGGYETESIYGATKACLESFARVWARELGKQYGATVNCVNPGPTNTDMWQTDAPYYEKLGILPDFKKEIPVEGRIAEPEDIARIVAFLCSKDSGWVSGSVVSANGGQVVF